MPRCMHHGVRCIFNLRFWRGPGQQQADPLFQLRRSDITAQACHVDGPGAYSLIISLIMSSSGAMVAGPEPKSRVAGKFHSCVACLGIETRPRSRPGLDPPSICELRFPPTSIDRPLKPTTIHQICDSFSSEAQRPWRLELSDIAKRDSQASTQDGQGKISHITSLDVWEKARLKWWKYVHAPTYKTLLQAFACWELWFGPLSKLPITGINKAVR